MPFVQVTAIKDVFTPEQKREVIQRVTDAMVAVEGEELRGVT
ncbi:MAG: tautomerase family protein [Halieaceae bacterium]|nr:tautomerase family protein [Halieaceae bacterium]